MRHAKNLTSYKKWYAEWLGIKQFLKKKGCAPPIPPAPIDDKPTGPSVENKCINAYKAGWKVGQDLSLLVTQTGGKYADLVKLMLCVKEYVAEKNSRGKASIYNICFDDGRKTSRNVIFALSKDKHKLALWLKQQKTAKHARAAYKLKYTEYIQDLLDMKGAKGDELTLNTKRTNLFKKSSGLKF